MDQEALLRWFCTNADFRVTKVLKQHWYESKYSYLNNPRPDFGLLLLESGNVSFVTECGTVSAQSGNLVFLSKNSCYDAVFSDEVDNYLICFDTDDERFLSCSPMILSESVDLICYERFRRLSDEYRFTVPTQLYSKGSFLLLLDSIIESVRNYRDEHNNIVKHACELLQKNEKLTVEQIAKKCAVSASLLRQLFIKKLGVSPTRYRTNIRIKQAMYLIESTNMSISEIAQTLSFFDTAYFCKVFRSHTGMTPKQYARSKRI